MSPDELKQTELPEGYILASAIAYGHPLRDRKTGLSYTHSVQLMNAAARDIPRGVGHSFAEALERAIANIMGDDGLSKALRERLQGTRQ